MGCAAVEGHCRQEHEGECHHSGDPTEPVDGMVEASETATGQAFLILASSPSFARPRQRGLAGALNKQLCSHQSD